MLQADILLMNIVQICSALVNIWKGDHVQFSQTALINLIETTCGGKDFAWEKKRHVWLSGQPWLAYVIFIQVGQPGLLNTWKPVRTGL